MAIEAGNGNDRAELGNVLTPSPSIENQTRSQKKERKKNSVEKEKKYLKGYTERVRQNPVGQKLPPGTKESTVEIKLEVFLEIQRSRASHSESSSAGNHKSPSGPSPCHRTL